MRTGPGRPVQRAGADPAAAPSPSTGLRGQTLSPSLSNYCLLKKKKRPSGNCLSLDLPLIMLLIKDGSRHRTT